MSQPTIPVYSYSPQPSQFSQPPNQPAFYGINSLQESDQNLEAQRLMSGTEVKGVEDRSGSMFLREPFLSVIWCAGLIVLILLFVFGEAFRHLSLYFGLCISQGILNISYQNIEALESVL
eukprot:TRINITY_DN3833_c0_g6_i1.p2 TRINITY_DN3833_c0_g6~~TRINITY_DN3833_c0_g6_i1.p2  ORF type:complete len:120 (+),score=11.54 TRINITY_DN3833_c0_g6_i1:51-410(+)